MSDWVHIDPPAPHLTPVQERIREMLRDGKTLRQICVALMMRSDHLRDEIFEIRKYEVLMGEKKRLTDEQKAAIIEMRQAGKPYKEISETVGCSKQTAINVWNAFLHSDKPAKKTTINKEFDDAVNEMIAEAKEPESTNEDTIVDTSDTIEDTKPEVPEAVLKAVQDKIDSLATQIAVNCERIESITEQNDRMKERSETLQKWLKEVQA